MTNSIRALRPGDFVLIAQEYDETTLSMVSIDPRPMRIIETQELSTYGAIHALEDELGKVAKIWYNERRLELIEDTVDLLKIWPKKDILAKKEKITPRKKKNAYKRRA